MPGRASNNFNGARQNAPGLDCGISFQSDEFCRLDSIEFIKCESKQRVSSRLKVFREMARFDRRDNWSSSHFVTQRKTATVVNKTAVKLIINTQCSQRDIFYAIETWRLFAKIIYYSQVSLFRAFCMIQNLPIYRNYQIQTLQKNWNL